MICMAQVNASVYRILLILILIFLYEINEKIVATNKPIPIQGSAALIKSFIQSFGNSTKFLLWNISVNIDNATMEQDIKNMPAMTASLPNSNRSHIAILDSLSLKIETSVLALFFSF